jgi:hypothetical protein
MLFKPRQGRYNSSPVRQRGGQMFIQYSSEARESGRQDEWGWIGRINIEITHDESR